MKKEDVEEVIYRKTRRRQEKKEVFDIRHKIKVKPFKEGDIMLCYDSIKEIDMFLRKKLDFK